MTIAGQHIFITSGAPKEIIDGVRHYANHARPEHQGLEAAKQLAAERAKVTLVTPEPCGQKPADIEIITKKPDGQPIVSARDLMESAEDYAKHTKDIKAVLHLANISSIRAAQVSAQKLKVKKETGQPVPMEVIGNIDAWQRLKAAFPNIPIIGYQNDQITADNKNPLAEALMNIAEKARQHRDNVQASPVTQEISNELAGKKIIVTSGPTAEKLTTQGDVITNFSSGKQGKAIADALAGMGADVAFVTGGTAREMLTTVMAQLPADVYIGVAAVADFGIENPIDLHLKEGEPYTLQLSQNPDILQAVGQHPTLRPKIVIGFAAETDAKNMLLYARGKLERKGADAICANQIDAAGNDSTQITWVTRKGADPWKMMEKHEAARAIGTKIAQMLESPSTAHHGRKVCHSFLATGIIKCVKDT